MYYKGIRRFLPEFLFSPDNELTGRHGKTRCTEIRQNPGGASDRNHNHDRGML